MVCCFLPFACAGSCRVRWGQKRHLVSSFSYPHGTFEGWDVPKKPWETLQEGNGFGAAKNTTWLLSGTLLALGGPSQVPAGAPGPMPLISCFLWLSELHVNVGTNLPADI